MIDQKAQILCGIICEKRLHLTFFFFVQHLILQQKKLFNIVFMIDYCAC